MKNKILFISLAVVLAASLAVGAIGCGGGGGQPPTDKIAIYASRSLSGGLELVGDYAFGPVMDLWLLDVANRGGIDDGTGTLKPVDLDIDDDVSNINTMTSLLTAAIASNTYHFIFPPISTAFLQSAAGITSANGYLLIGAEGGCTSIEATLSSYPYLMAMLNYSDWNQMEELFKILRYCQTDLTAPTPIDAYIIYIDDTHGWEYRDEFEAEMANYGANFTVQKKVPIDPAATDVSTQLLEASNWSATHGGVDIELFCSFTYPPASIITIAQANAFHYDFDAMLIGPGGNFEFLLLDPSHPSGVGVGGSTLPGVMGFGAWNEYSSAQALALTQKFVNSTGRYSLDWWGAAPYWAGLQCFEEAIIRAGSLDNAAVRAEFASAGWGDPKFTTVLGDTWFTNAAGAAPGSGGGLMAKDCYLGQIGQWNEVTSANSWASYTGGPARAQPYGTAGNTTWYIFEVIDIGTGKNTTPSTEIQYPKPAFPGYGP